MAGCVVGGTSCSGVKSGESSEADGIKASEGCGDKCDKGGERSPNEGSEGGKGGKGGES